MVMECSRRSKFEWTSEGMARLLKIGRREPRSRSRESIAGEGRICQMFRPDLSCSASRTGCSWSTFIRIGEGSIFQDRTIVEGQQLAGFQRLTRTAKD